MARKHLAIARWLAVPCLTFGLGWMLKPDPEPGQSSTLPQPRSVSKSSRARTATLPPPSERSVHTTEDKIDGSSPAPQVAGAAFPRAWSSRQISNLGQRLKHELDPIERRRAFMSLLAGMTVENAREIREQIAHLPSDSPEFRDFHYAWGKIAGAEAVLNGKDTPKPDMLAAMAGWASENPAAAAEWFGGLERQSNAYVNQEYLKPGMVQGLAINDVNLATDFVFAQAAAGDERAGRMMIVVTESILQGNGLEEAIRWSESLPQGALQASALDRVAHDYATSDPEGAAAWAEQFVGTEHNARVIEEVGHEWAGLDAPAAVAWAGSLDESRGRNQAISAAYGQWGARDPVVAIQTIIEMPPSSDRNYAINGFISGLAHQEPQTAVNWAAEISDPDMRQSALVRAGRHYFRQDQEAAITWLASSGLSEAAQMEVANPNRR